MQKRKKLHSEHFLLLFFLQILNSTQYASILLLIACIFLNVVSSLFIHPILNVLWVVFKFTLYLNSGVVAFLSWILHKAFLFPVKIFP